MTTGRKNGLQNRSFLAQTTSELTQPRYETTCWTLFSLPLYLAFQHFFVRLKIVVLVFVGHSGGISPRLPTCRISIRI